MDIDIVTTHEGNGYLSHKFVGVRFLKESKYAKTDSEFNAAQHISGSRVNFRPEYTVVATGTYVDYEGNTKVKKAAIADLTKDLKVKMYYPPLTPSPLGRGSEYSRRARGL